MPKLTDTRAAASNDGGHTYERNYKTRVMPDGEFWIDVGEVLEEIKQTAANDPERFKNVTFSVDPRTRVEVACCTDLKTLQALAKQHAKDQVESTVETEYFIYLELDVGGKFYETANGYILPDGRQTVEGSEGEHRNLANEYHGSHARLSMKVALVALNTLTTKDGNVSRTVTYERDGSKLGPEAVTLASWQMKPSFTKWQYDRIKKHLSPYSERDAELINEMVRSTLRWLEQLSRLRDATNIETPIHRNHATTVGGLG